MRLKCAIGLHEWKYCKCSSCGRIRDKEHRWNYCQCTECGKTRGRVAHERFGPELTCQACGAPAERWVASLRERICNLELCAIPDESKPCDVVKALNAAYHKILSDCSELIACPFVLCERRKDDVRQSARITAQGGLELRHAYGFSEFFLLIRRHGADVFSLYEFRYLQSEDDGGRGYYI